MSASTKSITTGMWRQVVQSTCSQLGVKLVPEWGLVFESEAPIILAMGGEGSGKSFQGALYATCKSILESALYSSSLYWVVGADFEDARKDFDYIVQFQERLGNVERDKSSFPVHRDQQSILTTKLGQTFVTISAYDFTKIGRDEPDGIVGAEVSRWFEEAFRRCEGRVLRKFGRAWFFASGSYESSLGWLADLNILGQGPNERSIRSYSIPAWANPILYPGGRQDPAILLAEASNSPSRFSERFGAVPAPPKGIIFSEFKSYLHVDSEMEFDEKLPVYLAVDPGNKVYCVLFVQFKANGEVWVLDEVYEHERTHEQIINECRSRPQWGLVRGGAIDIAAKQTHMGMPVPLDSWYKDTGLVLTNQKLAVEDSIERIRLALSHNPKTGRARMRISPRCAGLIAELGGGPSPLEGGGAWRYYESKAGLGPPRTDNADACKALAYLLAGPYGFTSPSQDSAVTYIPKREFKRFSGLDLLRTSSSETVRYL